MRAARSSAAKKRGDLRNRRIEVDAFPVANHLGLFQDGFLLLWMRQCINSNRIGWPGGRLHFAQSHPLEGVSDKAKDIDPGVNI